MMGRPFRREGKYTIFMIQHQNSDGEWVISSFDHFGTPSRAFAASGRCWQDTGYHGCYDVAEASEALRWMARKHSDHNFRVLKINASIQDIVVESAWKREEGR